MQISVKNFGPLTKGGSIDLDKRFYVFVGKNGSGKTYMANLFYNVLGGELSPFFTALPHDDFFPRNKLETQAPIEITPSDWDSLIKKMNQKSLEHFIELIKADKTLFEKAELNIFNRSYEEFIASNQSFVLHIKDEDTLLTCTKKSGDAIFSFKEKKYTLDHAKEIERLRDIPTRSSINVHFFHRLLTFIIPYQVVLRSFFLPANRSFFLSYWKYIFTAEREEKEKLLQYVENNQNTSSDNLKQFQAPYTNATKNLIDHLDKLDKVDNKGQSHYRDLVLELETLMGGKVSLKEGKEGIGRKRFTFEMQESGQEIELFLASSSVNQLAPLYVYFKYWANKEDNVLIIDEPEINLHPENQIKLLDILMKFANRNNNKVVITTHSTLMTDIVNNHIRIGQLQTTKKGKEWLKENVDWLHKNYFDINDNINFNDFGVYHFNGNAIQRYDVNDYGVYFQDFANTETKIKDVATELKTKIHEQLHSQTSSNNG